ncbi:hypothetical protein [Erwinia rhapontici]|uniref:hypothetical protein n=1 Tax=Erwinia rhapontici TaxID=55212 RepID=UPI003BA1121A
MSKNTNQIRTPEHIAGALEALNRVKLVALASATIVGMSDPEGAKSLKAVFDGYVDVALASYNSQAVPHE